MKLTSVHIRSVRIAPPAHDSEQAAFVVWIDTDIASDGQGRPDQIRFAVTLPCDPQRSTQQIVADAVERARALAGAIGLAPVEEWNRLHAEDTAKLLPIAE